jgi:regulator of replication initiation timing
LQVNSFLCTELTSLLAAKGVSDNLAKSTAAEVSALRTELRSEMAHETHARMKNERRIKYGALSPLVLTLLIPWNRALENSETARKRDGTQMHQRLIETEHRLDLVEPHSDHLSRLESTVQVLAKRLDHYHREVESLSNENTRLRTQVG